MFFSRNIQLVFIIILLGIKYFFEIVVKKIDIGLTFLFDLENIFDRLYVNSPFFFTSKAHLNKESLELAKKARNATLLLWSLLLINIGYLIYLQAILKIRF